MRSVAFILEDNAERRTAFQDQIQKLNAKLDVVFFDSAVDAIAWLREYQADVSLISLDHDLPIFRNSDGELRDCGTGRMVSDFLCTVPPTCPVIVHTSNASAGERMLTALRDADWPAERVYPNDDLAWIASEWSAAVRKFAANGLLVNGAS